MGKFIYVFCEKAKEELLSLGYTLLKADENTQLYIFKNDNKQTYKKCQYLYSLSDTLTF